MKSSVIICPILLCIACGPGTSVESPDAITEGIEAFDSGRLDYGFYWFDRDDNSRKAYDELGDQVLAVDTRFYDPTKPTLIHFHGWQPFNGPQGNRREGFRFVDNRNDVDVVTIQGWKDAGWNVAMFYWNQMADEIEVKNAEAKIHTANGPQGMRYSTGDGYETAEAPTQPLRTVAFRQLEDLLADNTSGQIRVTGHSLGAQLATETVHRMGQAVSSGRLSPNLMPERLELLDPFWSNGDKDYLDGRTPSERAVQRIDRLIEDHDLAVTIYKSSELNEINLGDENQPLQDRVAVTRHRYWYLNAFDVPGRHVNVRHHYFWGFDAAPPAEVRIRFFNRRVPTGDIAPSASAPTERIKEMMRSSFRWDQVEGRRTATPTDDQFERKSR